MPSEIPDHVPDEERQDFNSCWEVQAHLPEFPSNLLVSKCADKVFARALLAALKRGGFETRLVELSESFKLIEQSDGYAK
jgi:hypothetical protein